MDICMISDPDYPVPPIHGGPVQNLIFELSKRLAREGHRITVFSKRDPALPNYEEVEGVRYFRFNGLPTLPVPSLISSFNTGSSVRQTNLGSWGSISYPGVTAVGFSIPKWTFYSVTTLIKTLQCEVDIVQCFNPFVLLSYTVAKTLLKKPVVMRCGQLSKRIYWRLASLAEKVIAPSQFMKRHLSSYHRVPQAKIEIINNGVNTERFNPKIDGSVVRRRYGLDDSPLILFVGRVAPEKGIDCLIRSIPLVIKRMPDVKVLIAGPMDTLRTPELRDRYKRHLNDMIKKLDLHNIIFTGSVDVLKELPSIYAACDVFTCPSVIEDPFANVSIEAMASGKPVVATRLGGFPEIVSHGEDGYLVPKEREIELAEALITILKDDDLRKRMGRNAREKVEALFSWDTISKKYLKLYHEILA